MISFINRSECYGCSACASVCPEKCIVMSADEEGFLYPRVDQSKCIGCNLCEKYCPTKKVNCIDEIPASYASISSDQLKRQSSSSGGIFKILAEYVINNGGVVVGAAYDKSFHKVEHICIENLSSISLLSGSKYSQSELGNAFISVKDYLEKGRIVLFSGTPCQVAGLKCSLKHSYDSLLTVDVVCHGVPSPKAFEKYLIEKEEKYNSKITSVNLVDKKTGWHKRSVSINFFDNQKYTVHQYQDCFMKAFTSDIMNRPSCSKCIFKSLNYFSDITLGDFWGIEKIDPSIDDDKGTSLVIVRSDKGKELMSIISEKAIVKEVNYIEAIKGNPAITSSFPVHKNRSDFMYQLDEKKFSSLVKSYISDNNSLINKFRKKLKLN